VGSDRCDSGADATNTGDADGDDVKATEGLMSPLAIFLFRQHIGASYRMKISVYGAVLQLPPRDNRDHARREIQAPRDDRGLRAGLGVVNDDVVEEESVLFRKLAAYGHPATHYPVAEDPVMCRENDGQEREHNQGDGRNDRHLQDAFEAHLCGRR
jgi:hypothetical protein